VDAVSTLKARSVVRNSLPSPQERRRIRLSARVTAEEVAAALGVTRQTVCHWETGLRSPSGAFAEQYSALLSELARPA